MQIKLPTRIIIAIFCGGSSWTPFKIRQVSKSSSLNYGKAWKPIPIDLNLIWLKHISFWDINIRRCRILSKSNTSFFQVTFWFPKWRSLNPRKGHFKPSKRSLGTRKNLAYTTFPPSVDFGGTLQDRIHQAQREISNLSKRAVARASQWKTQKQTLWDLDLPKGAKWF